jgi:N-acylneuraminate cytidylyltransferase/CMP-N,N'-diacetyllegionaminic acid synthase
MYRNRKIIAVIPARGGSKGLVGKNVMPLRGKPLVVWTIEQALLCGYIDRTIVSTDDGNIADIARRHGADVPFIRPLELATDRSSTMDVLVHALDFVGREGKAYDIVVLLQPTSPLRHHSDISGAIKFFFEKRALAVVSVCQTEHHPFWTNTLPDDGCMKEFIRPEVENKARQDLPDYYRISGSLYVADVVSLLTERTFYGERTFAYIMPKERSVDIDSLMDFQFADFLLSKRQ